MRVVHSHEFGEKTVYAQFMLHLIAFKIFFIR